MVERNRCSQLVAQWIVSLAISVICCSILFVVFAGYLVDIRSTSNLITLRVETLQEKVRQLSFDLSALQKQAALEQKDKDNVAAAPSPQPSSAGVDLSEPASLEGQEPNKTASPMPPEEKGAPQAASSAAPSPATPPSSNSAAPAVQPKGQTPAQQ